MREKEISIVIADDHPIVREGFRKIIERIKYFKVVAESSDGREALEIIEKLKPDVAILDIDMPEMDGFDVARAIISRNLPTEIVFLTMHDDEEMFKDAIEIGAKGFVLKDSDSTEITKCIKKVAGGESFFSSSMTGFLLEQKKRTNNSVKQNPGLKELTAAEMRILKLIAQNKKTKEIAEELFISYRTVETHRSNICQKLGVKGTNSLLRFALSNKSEIL